MIEIFKTNVFGMRQAEKLINELLQHFPDSKINFDLDDCDKILRVECVHFRTEKIMSLLKQNGFRCRLLE